MLIPDESVIGMIKTREHLDCLYDICEQQGLKRVLTTLLKTDTDEQIRDKVIGIYEADYMAKDTDIANDYASTLQVYGYG